MQEVAKLRRSLDDAEGLSRDTKKEWAVLRSQNITLEETVVSWITEKWLNSINCLAQQLIECVVPPSFCFPFLGLNAGNQGHIC